MVMFELVRRFVSQGLMNSFGIVERFNVLENAPSGGVQIGV
jgi:hypothetical protein